MTDDPETFERYAAVLRPLLPYLGDEPVDRGMSLTDLGLDSFGIVQALVELEAEFGVEFPDDRLTAETFASVGSLWEALASLAEAGRADAR
ncbi:phosphopantetheine-binding protein [Nocardiopsis sp. CA-288880]|uniref:phosphopantetheine-binding protein n=1 Tax=Nocardiopsis sp. CA-288880 TaxID=3239995 RepID=UPI003D99E1B9